MFWMIIKISIKLHCQTTLYSCRIRQDRYNEMCRDILYSCVWLTWTLGQTVTISDLEKWKWKRKTESNTLKMSSYALKLDIKLFLLLPAFSTNCKLLAFETFAYSSQNLYAKNLEFCEKMKTLMSLFHDIMRIIRKVSLLNLQLKNKLNR